MRSPRRLFEALRKEKRRSLPQNDKQYSKNGAAKAAPFLLRFILKVYGTFTTAAKSGTSLGPVTIIKKGRSKTKSISSSTMGAPASIKT